MLTEVEGFIKVMPDCMCLIEIRLQMIMFFFSIKYLSVAHRHVA